MKENLLKIINHYGVLLQLKQFNYEYQYDACEVIGCKEHHIEKEKEHIAEEIADCMVMIHQFIEYYEIDNNDVCDIMQRKVDRQLERLNNEKDNKNN